MCVCQRTSVVNGPAIIWFFMRSCSTETTGRAIRATKAMKSRYQPWSAKNDAGDFASRIRSTRLPMKAIKAASITEPRNPATNRAAKAGHAWRTKCP